MGISMFITIFIHADPVCFTGVGHARLVNITSAANNEQGDQRVEVCGETNYYRRGVCDDNWDNTDARVLCRELGLLIQDNGNLTLIHLSI